MNPVGIFAALTVMSSGELGCPNEAELAEKLHAAGAEIRPEHDVHVQFSRRDGKREATIRTPGTEPRRLEHGGEDCASLADATAALLSVLLDALDENAALATATSQDADAPPMLRVDAAITFSRGIVAPFALGVSADAAWRPIPWGSVGLRAEAWPERAHAVRGGNVTVNASSLALLACVGRRWGSLALDGCVLGHGGLYGLSAEGFPIVRSQRRALWGGEIDLRFAVALTNAVGLFARAGLWVPLTRLDVTVRGADSGFVTSTAAPKGALGMELYL